MIADERKYLFHILKIYGLKIHDCHILESVNCHWLILADSVVRVCHNKNLAVLVFVELHSVTL